MYRALNKYGLDNFKIEEIEQCSALEINEREIYWINYYNTYKEGYNATLGGEGRPLADYDLIVKLWNEGNNRAKIITITGYDTGTITRALRGAGISEEELKQRQLHACDKPVARLDKDTLEVLQVYPSISAAEQAFNVTKGKSHISKVCNGKRQTTLGYKWKFV